MKRKCPFCENLFIGLDNWQNHIKRKHPNKLSKEQLGLVVKKKGYLENKLMEKGKKWKTLKI